MGWDNWIMEIIAFHNCDDLYAAKKLEQSYFEDYNATLNSVEPLPKPKPKLMKYTSPKERPHCEVCDVYFGSNNLLDIHNTTNKHRTNVIKRESMNRETIPKSRTIPKSYKCETCDYICCKHSDYIKHCKTVKHNNRVTTGIQPKKSPIIYDCSCGKEYNHRASLWNHKQKCDGVEQEPVQVEPPVDSSLVIELLKQNQEFKEMMIEQNRRMSEQQDTIIELSKIIGTHTTINTNS